MCRYIVKYNHGMKMRAAHCWCGHHLMLPLPSAARLLWLVSSCSRGCDNSEIAERGATGALQLADSETGSQQQTAGNSNTACETSGWRLDKIMYSAVVFLQRLGWDLPLSGWQNTTGKFIAEVQERQDSLFLRLVASEPAAQELRRGAHTFKHTFKLLFVCQGVFLFFF